MTCGSSSSHESQLSAFRQARNAKFRFRDFSRAIGRRLISDGNLDTAARPTVQIGVQGQCPTTPSTILDEACCAPVFGLVLLALSSVCLAQSQGLGNAEKLDQCWIQVAPLRAASSRAKRKDPVLKDNEEIFKESKAPPGREASGPGTQVGIKRRSWIRSVSLSLTSFSVRS